MSSLHGSLSPVRGRCLRLWEVDVSDGDRLFILIYGKWHQEHLGKCLGVPHCWGNRHKVTEFSPSALQTEAFTRHCPGIWQLTEYVVTIYSITTICQSIIHSPACLQTLWWSVSDQRRVTQERSPYSGRGRNKPHSGYGQTTLVFHQLVLLKYICRMQYCRNATFSMIV